MDKWQSLNIKEQGYLLLAVAAVTLILLWLGVISPVQKAVEKQRLSNQAYEQSLLNVRQLAAELKQLNASGLKTNQANGGLTQLVDSSLRQNGLKMTGFQPGSDGSVSLRFDNAPFDVLLSWLDEMENSQGVLLNELSLRKGRAAGYVAATVKMQMMQ